MSRPFHSKFTWAPVSSSNASAASCKACPCGSALVHIDQYVSSTPSYFLSLLPELPPLLLEPQPATSAVTIAVASNTLITFFFILSPPLQMLLKLYFSTTFISIIILLDFLYLLSYLFKIDNIIQFIPLFYTILHQNFFVFLHFS